MLHGHSANTGESLRCILFGRFSHPVNAPMRSGSFLASVGLRTERRQIYPNCQVIQEDDLPCAHLSKLNCIRAPSSAKFVCFSRSRADMQKGPRPDVSFASQEKVRRMLLLDMDALLGTGFSK
mmetsp:Transcript_4600/g.6367  ORF Transcript_4600/g.6367 Transcript_4600/m.6367 type:complete len:123 (-) Transcript_4600:468-836(-)